MTLRTEGERIASVNRVVDKGLKDKEVSDGKPVDVELMARDATAAARDGAHVRRRGADAARAARRRISPMNVTRAEALPPGLDVDRARARMSNGVLTVRFPKLAGRAGARRVPIQT